MRWPFSLIAPADCCEPLHTLVQAQPKLLYLPFGYLHCGKSTVAEVRSIFGSFRRVEQLPDGFIGYYEIELYNPFENHSGRGGR